MYTPLETRKINMALYTSSIYLLLSSAFPLYPLSAGRAHFFAGFIILSAIKLPFFLSRSRNGHTLKVEEPLGHS